MGVEVRASGVNNGTNQKQVGYKHNGQANRPF